MRLLLDFATRGTTVLPPMSGAYLEKNIYIFILVYMYMWMYKGGPRYVQNFFEAFKYKKLCIEKK